MKQVVGALCAIEWQNTGTEFDGVIEDACVVIGDTPEEVDANAEHLEQQCPNLVGNQEIIYLQVDRLQWMVARCGQYVGNARGGWRIINSDDMKRIHKTKEINQ